MKKLIVTTLLILVSKAETFAQDPQFSQFYAAPLYHNPAFAGAAHKGRLVANFRNQWPAIPQGFITAAFSGDTYFKAYNSGVGILAYRDHAGSGGLSTNALAVQYAYEIQFSSQWSGRGGLSFGYANRFVDFSKLTFRDQLNANFVPTSTSDPAQANLNRVGYFDISSGFLLYNRYLWFGGSALHMNQPNQSLLGNTGKLPMRVSLMAGAKIPLTKRRYGADYGANRFKEKSISPSVLYKRQGDFQQLDLGAYVTLSPLITGIWYRGLPVFNYDGIINQDALVWLLGFKHNNYSIGYSYDLTISGLGPGTAGSHEISLSYEFDSPKRRKKRASPIPCPKF